MKLFKKLLLSISFGFLLTACTEIPLVSNSDSTPSIDETNNSDSLNAEVSSESSDIIVDSSSEELPEFVDYVSLTKLNIEDPTKVSAEVQVYNFVDGDTTHFVPVGNPENWVNTEKNVLKARYNSCDTPESTGKVEPWGKTAADFTKTALKSATSIVLQSDTDKWETDTTGERYLVWVWYKTADTDYKLLNLELIQNGLAKLKSASSYSLYDTFNAANMQAILYEYHVYSKEKDPGYYYGKAISLDIRTLRENPKEYENVKVSVNGLIAVYDSYSHMAYAQQFDDETQQWYGIDVYLGFNSYEIIKVGNLVRLVGTLSYYETGENWQLTGLSYHRMNPDYEGSMKLLEKGVEVVPFNITSANLSNKADDSGIAPGESLQAVYVKIDGLRVVDVYTTSSTNLASNGAMTLTCKDSNDVTVTIRTSVLKTGEKDQDGNDILLTEADVLYKTISATGIVTKYDGKVQIHVFTLNELTIA